jgi:hypothetical protein
VIDLYPPRLFSIERRAIRSRIVIVIRRQRERGGALAYDGERYYDARYAPKLEQRPFEPRVVA